jgi:hypothetical protein
MYDIGRVAFCQSDSLGETYFPGLSRRPPPVSFWAASKMNSCNATGSQFISPREFEKLTRVEKGWFGCTSA